MNKNLIAAGFILTLLVLSGCQAGWQDGRSSMVSAGGVKAEALLPDDVWMIVKFGTADAAQTEKLMSLMDMFPTNPVEYLISEVAAEIEENNTDLGVDFENDFLPAMGEKMQTMIAFSGSVSDEEEPVLTAVLIPEDAEKFESIIRKMPENGKGSEIEWEGYKIYSNETEDAFMVRYEDVLIVSSDMDNLKKAVTGTTGRQLLVDQDYQEGVKKTADGFAFLYIDPSVMYRQMDMSVFDSEEEAESIEQLINVMEAVKGEYIGLYAEDDGIRMKIAVNIDAKKYRELGFPMIDDGWKSYMYKNLPGENLLLYSESYGLKYSLELLGEMYGGIEEFSQGVAMMKAGLVMQGIDPEDDLIAFMDKGYALAVHGGDDLIPELSVWFDAGSAPEGASKVMGKIYDGISALLEESAMDEEIRPALSNEKADCGEGECYSFVLDLSRYPEDLRENMGPGLMDEKIFFNYGLTSDNLAYFSMLDGLFGGDLKTVDRNEKFKEALGYVPGYEMQVSFVDVEGFAALLDKWVEYSMMMDGNEMGAGMEDYYAGMEYVRPVKYVVSGAKTVGESSVDSELFVKISK